MAQQINLCTPLFLAPRRYFSAQTMAQALAVFVGVSVLVGVAQRWFGADATDGNAWIRGRMPTARLRTCQREKP